MKRLSNKCTCATTQCIYHSEFHLTVLNTYLTVGGSKIYKTTYSCFNLNKCYALVVGSYSLSMRQDRGHVHSVKHYRIHQLHNGWFYIHQSHYFSTLTQLVDYYSRKLKWQWCCKLNISPVPPSKDSLLHFNEDKNI